jgi:hypothetical protein
LECATGTTELAESNIAHPYCSVSLWSEEDIRSLASSEDHLFNLIRLNVNKVIRNDGQFMVIDAEVQQ